MSKRLQVMIDEEDLKEIRCLADQQRISVAEWVRRALQAAKNTQPKASKQRKLESVRTALQYEFPSADIDQMIGEIESGYGTE